MIQDFPLHINHLFADVSSILQFAFERQRGLFIHYSFPPCISWILVIPLPDWKVLEPYNSPYWIIYDPNRIFSLFSFPKTLQIEVFSRP